MTAITRCAALVVAVLGLAGGCGEPVSTGAGSSGGDRWERLPASPLAARRAAHAFALDGKLLVVGGTAADPCPPTAGCIEPREPPLTDGAAYDPSTKEWSPVAPAPVPVGHGTGAVAGGRLYLLVSGYGSSHPAARPAFLSYAPDRGRWRELPLPPHHESLHLVAHGGEVVAYRATQENGVRPDFVYDPDAGTWSELPPDPLAPSFDRTMVSTDAGLVLLGVEVVPQPGATRPSFYRAAVLDGRGQWVRLPDSDVIGWNPQWGWSEGRVVNASIESADGGETGNWGRSYPAGGMLDPAAGAWEELPEVPAGPGAFTGLYAAGPRGIVAGSGWVLDVGARRWVPLARPRGAPQGEAAVAWVGDALFVWGGARFDGHEGELLGEGWVWEAPW